MFDFDSFNSYLLQTLATYFLLQTIIRKREVVISRVSVYIVVILVSCHTIRIIPNVWEIAQTITAGSGPKVNIIDLLIT